LLVAQKKTTISLIKCDVGSLAGHHVVPSPLFKIANRNLENAAAKGVINNFYVFNAGDYLELLMVHEKGERNHMIHELAWNTFKEAADKALELKLYGAGQRPPEDSVQRQRLRHGTKRSRNGD
jgi:fructose 1,6-bisphosphate aldolase/phosphatase